MANIKSPIIARKEVLRILRSRPFLALESKVARALDSEIIDMAPEITVDKNVEELNLAGLSSGRISELLDGYRKMLPAFSIALFRGEDKYEQEQEWGPLEADQQLEIVEVDLGLCRGFGLSHLCYLSFLVAGRDGDLLRFLKAWQVPKPKAYCGRLQDYFAQAKELAA